MAAYAAAVAVASNTNPTASTGTVTFTIGNPAAFVGMATPFYALHSYQSDVDAPLTRGTRSQWILVTTVNGAQVTATLGQLNTAALSISFSDLIDASYLNQPYAAQAVPGDTLVSVAAYGWPTAAARSLTMQGSGTTPVQLAAQSPAEVLISRHVITDNALAPAGDGGAFTVQQISYQGGKAQVNGIQSLIEQRASADAMAFGGQIIMKSARGGGGYGYYMNIDLLYELTVVFTTGTVVVSVGHHGYANGDAVAFRADGGEVLPSNITAGFDYFVRDVSENAFAVASTPGGAAIVFTGSAPLSGVAMNNVVALTIASPCVVYMPKHGATTGKTIRFGTSGALPTGVTPGTLYNVNTIVDADHFTLANPGSGVDLNTSGTQSGIHRAVINAGAAVLNPLMANGSGVDFPFDQYGSNILSNILLQNLASPNHKNGTAIIAVNNDGSAWDTILGAQPGTVGSTSGSFLRDWASGYSSYDLRGTHTIALDLRTAVNGFHVYFPNGKSIAPVGTDLRFTFDDADQAYLDYVAAADRWRFNVGGNPVLTVFAGGVISTGYLYAPVIATPAAPAASNGEIYFDTSGGKVRLMARFPTGAAQVVATEP